ncbi:hypothetical protein DPSP01_011217 [Paraphaeosphaeria sporulosa]
MAGINGSNIKAPKARDLDIPLETTLLVNSLNPTTVGVWDLQQPSNQETAKRIHLPRRPESIGAGGDHRVLVDESAVLPGGKYRAICKLYLCYTNLKDQEFIGTGWLVNSTTVATAGHCLYDREDTGGYLQYIKVYFGFHGSSSTKEATCIYRHGVSAAIPAEYLKAQSYQHDVGFITLNQPVTDIEPVKYTSTPKKTSLKLGVVGFPGDRDFGQYLYEHWEDVDIDLASNDVLLSYKIDTTGGQSGSPILRSDLKAVGVHVAGGYPNIGSCIGPAGNRFEEYILALDVKGGKSSSNASVAKADDSFASVPGFQIVSVSPTAFKGPNEKARPITNGNLNGHHYDDVENEVAKTPKGSSELEKMIDTLFGGSKKPTPKGKIATGKITNLPEVLRIDRNETGEATPPSMDMAAIMKRAGDQNDPPAVIRVNFPTSEMMSGKARESYVSVKDMIASWSAWATTTSERQVQLQIDKKALSADAKGAFARSSHRAMVWDWLFRQSTWFAKITDQNVSRNITKRKLEFHTAILTAVLEGFILPTSILTQLEAILNTISNGILEASSVNDTSKQQYWIMLTRYSYDEYSDSVDASIRTISFSVSQDLKRYTVGKSSYEEVNIDMIFSQYEANFNQKIFAKIQDEMDGNQVAMGAELMKKSKNADFEIPVSG